MKRIELLAFTALVGWCGLAIAQGGQQQSTSDPETMPLSNGNTGLTW
jgi:hypothetical protein